MAKKGQWNVRLEDQVIERLAKQAQKLGYDSANEFAADALDKFAEALGDWMLYLKRLELEGVEHARVAELEKMRQSSLSRKR